MERENERLTKLCDSKEIKIKQTSDWLRREIEEAKKEIQMKDREIKLLKSNKVSVSPSSVQFKK